MNFFKKNVFFLSVILFVIFYIMVLQIGFHTPMHSDDFPTSVGGLPSFESLSRRYFGWSGRLVADIIAPLLLISKSHFLVAAINSLGIPILVGLCSYLALELSEIGKKNFPQVFFLGFLLYWFCCPSLGEGAFWVVGAANYTWTTIINIFFLLSVVLIINNKVNKWYGFVFLVLLGLVAGCTNENMGGATISFLIVFYIKEGFRERRINTTILVSLLGVFIGFLTLVLAPGNVVRIHTDTPWWVHTSLIDKLINGVKLNVNAYRKDLPILLGTAFFAVISFSKIKGKDYIIPFSFIIGAIVSNASMIASPIYPYRAMSGQFSYLLCSCLVFVCWSIEKKRVFLLKLFSIFLIVLFAVDYYFMNSSYTSAYRQSFIRERIIKENVLHGEKNITIPDYFFKPLVKNTEKFDLYRSSFMKNYYSIDSISYIEPKFDYSIIDNDGWLNMEGAQSNNIKFFLYTNVPFYSKMLIIQAEDVTSIPNKVAVLMNNGDEKVISLEGPAYEIEGKFYKNVILKNMSFSNIKTVKCL